MLAALHIHFHACERQTLADLGLCSKVCDTVFLVLGGCCIKSIAEQHIIVERVVLRAHRFLGVAVVHGEVDLRLRWQQLAKVHLCGDGVV